MKSTFYKFLLITCMAVLPLSSAMSEENHGKDEHHDHDEKSEHKNKNQDDEHNHDAKSEHDDHDEHSEHGEEEESTGGVGPGNAVTAADEHDGIKLSDKAQNAIGLKTETFTGGDVMKSALVFHQDKVSVYRFKDGWFKMIPVTDLKAGDQVVVSGTALLRVAELDAFSTETGHSH